MNLDSIEVLLSEQLKRLLGRDAEVRTGPVSELPLGGMRKTVFVHAARFEDHGGVTADGANIARRPVRAGRAAGFAEERPARIVIEINCITMPYGCAKALAEVITPVVLLALAGEREFVLGASANGQITLKFADFQASLHEAETQIESGSDVVYHRSRLVFHIDGALHVMLTKSGGLRRKRPGRRTTTPSTGKKPRTKTRSKTRAKA